MLRRTARVLNELWHLTMFDCLIHNDLAICKPALIPLSAGFLLFTRSNIRKLSFIVKSYSKKSYIFLENLFSLCFNRQKKTHHWDGLFGVYYEARSTCADRK